MIDRYFKFSRRTQIALICTGTICSLVMMTCTMTPLFITLPFCYGHILHLQQSGSYYSGSIEDFNLKLEPVLAPVHAYRLEDQAYMLWIRNGTLPDKYDMEIKVLTEWTSESELPWLVVSSQEPNQVLYWGTEYNQCVKKQVYYAIIIVISFIVSITPFMVMLVISMISLTNDYYYTAM